MVIVVHNMKYGAKILYIYDIHKFCNYFLNKFEKKSQQLEIQWPNYYIQLVHFLRQFAGLHLHAVEGEPLFAKVLDAGAEVIDCLVDAEEAVVRAVELYDTYWRILRIVFLDNYFERLLNMFIVLIC